MTTSTITVQQYLESSELREQGWYWNDRIVCLDPACPTEPFIILKGRVVDVPKNAELKDW